MQISLKDLLGAVGFCAVVAWCGAHMGYRNEMFWIVVGVSAIISLLFVVLSGRVNSRLAILWITIPAVFVCFFLGLFARFLFLIGIDAFFLSIAAVGLVFLPIQSTRMLSGIAMVCAVATIFIGVLPHLADIEELRQMQRQYPIISLVNRLTYEKLARRDENAVARVLSASANAALTTWEIERSQNAYDYLFQQLHSRYFEDFIRAEGFGVRRMPYVRASTLAERPLLRNIPFNQVSALKSTLDEGSMREMGQGLPASSLDRLHEVSHDDFLDANYYGGVISADGSFFNTTVAGPKPPTAIAGFIEHAMHYPPRAALKDPEAWTIDRLELVSLLKFDGPRVYVLDHLPRMDQLAAGDAPTRALDEFEAEALPQLATEKDVVVEQDGDNVRMLGSLRAAKQCLNCHSVQRGELLGAFSYAIRRGAAGEGQ